MRITIETDDAGVTTLTVDGEQHSFTHVDTDVGRVQAFIAAAHVLADPDAPEAEPTA